MKKQAQQLLDTWFEKVEFLLTITLPHHRIAALLTAIRTIFRSTFPCLQGESTHRDYDRH